MTIVDALTGRSLGSITMEKQPTHFHAHGDQIVIFNDGTGSISVFDEKQLDAGNCTPQHIQVGQPDHGSAVILDDLILAGFLRLGRVDVFRLGESEAIHGNIHYPARYHPDHCANLDYLSHGISC